MGFGQRAGKFNELGRIQSIKAADPPLTLKESYTITSVGQPASVIHARDPIFKPGTETALESDATFFAPTESYGSDGVPQYSQYVINDDVGSSLLVSQYKEYFSVTAPGTMGTKSFYAFNENSGAATVVPESLSEPSAFRREGTVEITVTNSNDADPEVAYSDEGVDWCSIGFVTSYTNDDRGTATISASFRNFPKYLNSLATNNSAFAQTLGVYRADAVSNGTGSKTYNTNGIYRSQVVPFFKRDVGGVLTQYYLKTNVTFTAASVNATAGDHGSISPSGFKEYSVGDTPAYTITPDATKRIVSVKLDGADLTFSNPGTGNPLTLTFGSSPLDGANDLSVAGRNKSLEATFGNQLTLTKVSGTGTISTSSPQFVENGGSVTINFSTTPSAITLNDVAQTFSGTSFVATGFSTDSELKVTFS
jgi:hypothetical protein|tara:strand:+ start:157 stop:1422 length:1266 start_codon:yes stop_codon:yes gene_type:complete